MLYKIIQNDIVKTTSGEANNNVTVCAMFDAIIMLASVVLMVANS